MLGGSSPNSIFGCNNADSLFGDGSNDVISGDDGADTIYGGDGADGISGGNGDDRLYGGIGNNTMDAGAGTGNRIRYDDLNSTAPVTVVIENSGSSSGFNRATVSTAAQGTDSIMGFEILTTKTGNDHITVNSVATANTALHVFAHGEDDTIIFNTTDNTNSHNLVPFYPFPQPDRLDAPWLADEPVPCMTAVINGIIVMTKHAIG